jgi:hypothetical protein
VSSEREYNFVRDCEGWRTGYVNSGFAGNAVSAWINPQPNHTTQIGLLNAFGASGSGDGVITIYAGGTAIFTTDWSPTTIPKVCTNNNPIVAPTVASTIQIEWTATTLTAGTLNYTYRQLPE